MKKEELERLLKLSSKKAFNLQLFTEDGGESAATGEDGAGDDPNQNEPGSNEDGKKYSDEDVNKIIAKKFSEWEKKQEAKSKKAAEAQRLKNMTDEEKRAHELKVLQEKIASYEKREAVGEMTKVARGILSDSKISVNEELLASLVTEDAETTKANVENFVKYFNDAVQKAVAEKLRGNKPVVKNSSTKLTKEEIMKVTNRAERQKLIQENMELFR